MMQSVEAAREATQATGDYSRERTHGGAQVEELMEADPKIDAPSISTTLNLNNSRTRVDARIGTNAPNTETDIHAYSVSDSEGDRGRTNIKRYDKEGNLVYEHRFKSPETAQKFAAKIGEQVTARAVAKAASQEEKVA
jgi:hypothetical protein